MKMAKFKKEKKNMSKQVLNSAWCGFIQTGTGTGTNLAFGSGNGTTTFGREKNQYLKNGVASVSKWYRAHP